MFILNLSGKKKDIFDIDLVWQMQLIIIYFLNSYIELSGIKYIFVHIPEILNRLKLVFEYKITF